MPQSVVDSVTAMYTQSYAQLGAGYQQSDVATDIVAQAHAFGNELLGGGEGHQAILGSSTTQLLNMLAACYRPLLDGKAIVIAENGHEANIGCWTKLGIEVRWWKADPLTGVCSLDDLQVLLADGKVALVAFAHVSNLLGEVYDVAAVTAAAHAAGAKVVVDGVAYAAHRPVLAHEWDCDWYVASIYKVYGPHMAVMVGKKSALAELKGPNHFFVEEGISYKFELGGVPHESCAGLLGVKTYLQSLATSVKGAFEVMSQLEQSLMNQFVEGSAGWDVRWLGPHSARFRVPTFSFVSRSKSSDQFALAVNATGRFGIRHGHMYGYRLCERMGVPVEPGVVRISMVHYNSAEEVSELLKCIGQVMA